MERAVAAWSAGTKAAAQADGGQHTGRGKERQRVGGLDANLFAQPRGPDGRGGRAIGNAARLVRMVRSYSAARRKRSMMATVRAQSSDSCVTWRRPARVSS